MRSRQGNFWRKHWIVCMTALAAISGASVSFGAIRRLGEPMQLGVYPRPASGSIETIREVAARGLSQNVKFKAGARIARFIAKKCGLSAATMELHPEYESILLQQNRNSDISHRDLFELGRDIALDLPACAGFSSFAGEILVSEGGISKLAETLSIPFSSEAFSSAVERGDLHTQLADAVKHARTSGAFDEFRLLSDRFCKQTSPVLSYLGCLNALTIAGANVEVKDANSFRGKISVPIAGIKAPNSAQLDRVPLNDAAVAADANIEFQGFAFCTYVSSRICDAVLKVKKVASVIRNTQLNDILPDQGGRGSTAQGDNANLPRPKVQTGQEAGLKFVTEANSTDPSCTGAADLNDGKWPFDVAEFQRAARLSDIEHGAAGKILIADTGFDFAGDEFDKKVLLDQTKDIFLRKNFHVFPHEKDPNDDDDWNHDGVNGNGGWAGDNLAGRAGGAKSARSIAGSDFREHGLSVTTLAMGGRQLDGLRSSDKVKVEIGEINLVPEFDPPYLTADFVSKTVKFAKAEQNDFDIINLSLSSEVHEDIWDQLSIDKQRLTFVVAAGNDGRQLNSTSKDGVWPATLGGAVATDDRTMTMFITVGAHDGKGKPADFSNYGMGVDLFAPGCAVPSYVLKLDGDKNVIGIVEKPITGTSAAAPLVSFGASLLAGNSQFEKNPSVIKTRIQIGTDYDYSLQSRAFTSGVFNIAKVIGFKHDIIELADKNRPASKRKLSYGAATLVGQDGNDFKCDLGPPIPIKKILKISRGDAPADPILILAADDPTKRNKLTPHFCPLAALSRLKINFADTETNANGPIDMDNFRDYVAKR